jgi:hypothetical protein
LRQEHSFTTWEKKPAIGYAQRTFFLFLFSLELIGRQIKGTLSVEAVQQIARQEKDSGPYSNISFFFPDQLTKEIKD